MFYHWQACSFRVLEFYLKISLGKEETIEIVILEMGKLGKM